MSARSRFLGQGGNGSPVAESHQETEEERQTKRGAGANQSKPCCRFIPHPTNTAFNSGDWLELPYSGLVQMIGDAEWKRITITYNHCVITVTGINLKPIADGLGSFRQPLVHQTLTDELQAKAKAIEGGEVVYGLELAVLGEEAR